MKPKKIKELSTNLLNINDSNYALTVLSEIMGQPSRGHSSVFCMFKAKVRKENARKEARILGGVAS